MSLTSSQSLIGEERNLFDESQAKPLKICLLSYRSQPYGGGQGIYIKYLSKALVNAGHSVDVISGQPYPHLDPRVRLIPMPSLNLFESANHVTALRPRHLLSYTDFFEWFSMLTGGFSEPYTFGRRIVRYLKQHGSEYDVIHDNQSLCYGLIQLQKLGMPIVCTVHHPITSDRDIALASAKKLRQRLLIRRWHSFLRMQKKVIRQLNHVVTVSNRSRTDIASAFGVPRANLTVVYNGIDTKEFRPIPEITRKPFRIMATASADTPLKGLDYLLQAVAKLTNRYPKLDLLVVGKLRLDGETHNLIKRLGIETHLKFVSGIDTEQLVRYYAEAMIVVVPSVYEGFGLPAGEAMASGVPVIATEGGALPEVVGDAAILVPVKDSDAIAGAISDLLENPARRNLLGNAGRQRITRLFSWEIAAQMMTRYYRKVLADADEHHRL